MPNIVNVHTVSSHVRSYVYFVNMVVQIVCIFEGPSQYNFIVHIFLVFYFHLYKEQLHCNCTAIRLLCHIAAASEAFNISFIR